MYDLEHTLHWLFIVMFSFLTKLAVKFHTNPYILTLKWSPRYPGLTVQQLRDLVRGTVVWSKRCNILGTSYPCGL